MASLKTAFEAQPLEPFYSGGDVRLMNDDSTLVSVLDDEVIFTDIHTGERQLTIPGDEEPITTMEVTPDGKYLITCSRSLQMQTYKLPEGEKVHGVKAHESPVIVMAVDPTSTLVATGGAEGAIKVWDIEGGYVTHNLRGHGGIISALKFWGKRGTTDWKLASGSDDCKIRLWDLTKSKCLAVLDGHVSVIRGLDFSSDGDVLISGSRDKVVNVWSTSNYKLKDTLPVMESLETTGFIGSGSSKTIYTAGEDGEVKLWDTVTKKLIAKEERYKTTEEISCSQVIVSQDSSSVYGIYSDQTIVQFNVPDLSVVRRLAGNQGEVIDCRFLDDKRLAVATNSPEIRLLSLDDPLSFDVLTGHRDIVICIDVTYGGDWLVSAGKDNEIRLWHKKELHSIYQGHTGSIGAVALPRIPISGKKAPEFIISGSQDLTVKRWDPKTGSAVYTRKAHDKDINAIDVSPDNRYFATASQDRTVKIWDVDSGETVALLKGHKRGVWAVNFSQYEKFIATGSGDKTVKLWNLSDYSCVRTFEGHSGSVLKTVFINKGLQIASAGGDGLVRVWDKASGECVSTLDNHEDRVWTLAVSEQDLLVSGGADGVINVWKDVTEEIKQQKEEENSKLVEQEQELDNLVRKKDWIKALKLSLELDHPFRLLKLFREVKENQQGITGLEEVDEAIGSLDIRRIGRLLERVRDWNTSARNSVIAQSVLHVILKYHGHNPELIELAGITNLIDAIQVYSNRNYRRTLELLDDSYVVDYTVKEMQAL